MASSSGSSPASRRPRFEKLGALLWLCLFPALAVADPLPDYLRTALNGFHTDVPAGWAYTLATTRNDQRMTERYDPASPPAGQWTLLEWLGQAPDAEEAAKYARSRPHATAGGAKANFNRTDIEPASLALVREDDHVAEWTAVFRETSTGPDKMLGHLQLTLTVTKQSPHVSAYVLELKEPYWPVLGVKMLTLRVEVRYLPPAEGRPALPERQVSRFSGRILFIPTEEELELRYTDYQWRSGELSR